MRSQHYHALFVEEDYPHFITSTTINRELIFSNSFACKLLMDEIYFYAKLYKVELIAFVIMPDHFHLIIWPEGDKTFFDYMKGVKGHFAKTYSDEVHRRGAGTPPINNTKTQKIWQDSFFDYLITTDCKLEEKILYIMNNPVEDGLVKRSNDYPFLHVNQEYKPW